MPQAPRDPFPGLGSAVARPTKAAARRRLRRGQSDAALFLLGFTALVVLAWMLFSVGGDPHRLNTAEMTRPPHRGTIDRVPQPMPVPGDKR